MSKKLCFSGADVNRFENYKYAHEVLDIVIDEWCDRERERRRLEGLPPISKLELKNELGRAIGLGNGDADNSAGKGIYRYCSGETPITVEKALQICHYIKKYDFIQWIGYQAGMLMTHRIAIENLDGIDEDDMLYEIVSCLKDTTKFVETLSSTYQSKASFEAIRIIEDVFMKAILQMEKTRIMLKKLIERMLKPGTQGSFWLMPEKKKKKR
ncbi:hypothetical protein A45J_0377 [hot springs metagenome]|uniref:Uncharacterized protein n=1 Tax=hot springs metagenome TaxID=433727 RepID=A0A5J4L2Y6_9ZZZZ